MISASPPSSSRMDTEFHYYMTYLIAARAGFAAPSAEIIAHAAQGVDDNHIPVSLTDSQGVQYQNCISQTMDILHPHTDLLIYPVFHFIPGDPHAPSAQRVDGRIDPWVTTPNSALANRMIDAALQSGDLYRIGVSAHGYVDTWAHQNFVGKRDLYNEFTSGRLIAFIKESMAVGHAHAGHQPDWPALVWEDTRLVSPTVDNRVRFLDAARHLYAKFALHVRPALSAATLREECEALLADLDADIGPRDDGNSHRQERMARYLARARTPAYGGTALPLYDDDLWFSQAIAEDRRQVRATAASGALGDVVGGVAGGMLRDVEDFAGDFIRDVRRTEVTWKDPRAEVHADTHWYRFQEAVRAHRDACQKMLIDDGLLPPTV